MVIWGYAGNAMNNYQYSYKVGAIAQSAVQAILGSTNPRIYRAQSLACFQGRSSYNSKNF